MWIHWYISIYFLKGSVMKNEYGRSEYDLIIRFTCLWYSLHRKVSLLDSEQEMENQNKPSSGEWCIWLMKESGTWNYFPLSFSSLSFLFFTKTQEQSWTHKWSWVEWKQTVQSKNCNIRILLIKFNIMGKLYRTIEI